MGSKAVKGDNVSNPLFSPDGKSIIFDRCDTDSPNPDKCRIHVYDLATGSLGYYKPLPGQAWMMAYYADSGDKLVFVTFPTEMPVGDLSTYNEYYFKYQIATMNIDGSNMRVVTKGSGFKIYPAFSHSGKKVIFPQTETMRKPGSKTVASRWDLWELDLETGRVGLYAGKFEFFQLGRSVYFPDDKQVLLNGDSPMSKLVIGPESTLAKSISDYDRRYNRSKVIVVSRGQTMLESPMFTDLVGANHPSSDAQGNVFFDADGGPKEGIRIRRVGLDGSRQSWRYPPHDSDSSANLGTAVSRDGRYFVIALNNGPTRIKNAKLLLLDTESGIWRELILPHEATQINQ
ncbi:MAG: PD40 domain-containing protein [Nitrospirae bacterium]|nr:PD40 domain-containing protein [Nitrospirota bacterium]